MPRTDRFESVFQAVDLLVKDFGFKNQEATHWVWHNMFRMGTDRSVWVNMPDSCPIK